MKYLFLILLLVGCTKSEYEKRDATCKADLDKCQVIHSDNMRYFQDKCEKLAGCLKAEWSLVHLPNQSGPTAYACEISKKTKKFTKARFFYPNMRISFGKVEFSGLEEGIQACEFLTETGEFSDEHYESIKKAFEYMDKEKAEREKPVPPPRAIKMKVVE